MKLFQTERLLVCNLCSVIKDMRIIALAGLRMYKIVNSFVNPYKDESTAWVF